MTMRRTIIRTMRKTITSTMRRTIISTALLQLTDRRTGWAEPESDAEANTA